MTTISTDTTLLASFAASAEHGGDAPFLWAKRERTWTPWSWRRVAEEVDLMARALRQLGLDPGDRVVLVAENRPEWCIADLAVMRAGGITVPAYTTNTPNDHAYILNHAGAKMVVCSGKGLAKNLMPAVARSPSVRTLLLMEPFEGVGNLPVSSVSWADALALGRRAPPLDDVALRPDDTACFIYTSGTGGQPKGVMLSHRNILANVKGAKGVLDLIGLSDHETFLSFLPLSHSYEHTAGQFFPIAIGAQIYYAEGVEHLSSNLAEVKPTIVTCVPRLYEVMRQKILAGIEREGGLKARLFKAALRLGSERYHAGGTLPWPKRLLDRPLETLVRKKVGERFGGRLKAMVSGGAPLNEDVGLFFTALGVPVLQGYGQTESAPVIAVNLPKHARLETVGPPLKGVEVKIAEDGEILVRGENVMQGYWQDPDATAATIKDGWLHTGDVGVLDANGYLRITDRKKDLIVNSGGDNIAPQRVEGILLLENVIGQALVYGDKKPYLVALVTPHTDFVRDYANEHGLSPDMAALREDQGFRKAIGEAVKRANMQLSALERVRKFEVMAEPFSVENGMMTPTLKLRRPIIYGRYRDMLEGLYAAGR